MAKKQNITDYSNLAESTKQKYDSFTNKAFKSGVSFKELREMNDTEFANTMGMKLGKKITKGINKGQYTNIKAHRRIITQIESTETRREKTIERTLVKYKNLGFKGKGLDRVEKNLIRTTGNVFNAVAKEIYEKKFKKDNASERIKKRRAHNYTKKLLSIPKSYRKKLDKIDKDILSDFSP